MKLTRNRFPRSVDVPEAIQERTCQVNKLIYRKK